MGIIPNFQATYLKKSQSGDIAYFAKGFDKPSLLIDKLYIKKYVLFMFLMKLVSLLTGWIFIFLMLNNKIGTFGLSRPTFFISYLATAMLIIILPFYIGVKLFNKQYKIIGQNQSEMLDADIKIISPFFQKSWLNFVSELFLWVLAFVIVSKMVALPWKVVSALAFIMLVGICLIQISKITYSNWPERKP